MFYAHAVGKRLQNFSCSEEMVVCSGNMPPINNRAEFWKRMAGQEYKGKEAELVNM